MLYIVEEIQGMFERNSRIDIKSSINDSDETKICESLCLNHICWIEDELPRFRHIARDNMQIIHEKYMIINAN